MREKKRKGTLFSDGFREFYQKLIRLSTSPPAFTLGRSFSSGIWGQLSTVKSPVVV